MPIQFARPAAFAAALGLLALACAQTPPSPEPVSTAVAATLTAVAQATSAAATPATQPPTQAPTATLAPTEAATPTPLAAACPPPGDPPPIPAGEFAGYAEAVRAFLNAGGSVPALAQALQDVGVLDPAGAGGIAQLADLTGDQLGEVVVALLDTHDQSAGPVPPGRVLIFLCGGGAFQTAYDSGLAYEFGAPAVVAVQDVTQDGLNDLLYTTTVCGASTCFQTLYVIAWDGAAFANVVNGDASLAFAEITLRAGAGGAVEVEMYGGAQGSVGAGPPRQSLNVWAWDGTAIVLRETRPDPAEYRFHLLNDADDAAQAGDHAQAVVLYDRVIRDETLLGWEAVADERAHLSAYALFRTVVSRYAAGDVAGAQAALTELQSSFPAGAPGSEWGPVAEAFNSAYQPAENVSTGCAAAVAYVAATPAVLEPFANYGYGNRVYEAVDTCPF
jgi:hypothetical protein